MRLREGNDWKKGGPKRKQQEKNCRKNKVKMVMVIIMFINTKKVKKHFLSLYSINFYGHYTISNFCTPPQGHINGVAFRAQVIHYFIITSVISSVKQ